MINRCILTKRIKSSDLGSKENILGSGFELAMFLPDPDSELAMFLPDPDSELAMFLPDPDSE